MAHDFAIHFRNKRKRQSAGLAQGVDDILFCMIAHGQIGKRGKSDFRYGLTIRSGFVSNVHGLKKDSEVGMSGWDECLGIA